MGSSEKPLRERELSWIDWLTYHLSERHRLDEIHVLTSTASQEDAWPRIRSALELIKDRDRIRFRRLSRDIRVIWARRLYASHGAYRHDLRACLIDTDVAVDPDTSINYLASLIVHEATHARIENRGIAYTEQVRARIEAVCFRRELAFANRLENPDKIKALATWNLQHCDDAEFWTDQAIFDRSRQARIDWLLSKGVPKWLLRWRFGERVAE